MRPKKHETTRSGDLFRARLDQIINLKHELAQLAGKVDWDWIDGEIAPLYSEKGRPGIETRFAIGLLLLKHIYALSDARTRLRANAWSLYSPTPRIMSRLIDMSQGSWRSKP
jgi:hypothetical protein